MDGGEQYEKEDLHSGSGCRFDDRSDDGPRTGSAYRGCFWSEQTWQSAAAQIKTVVNSVVFPALDMILVVLLFVKIASAYMDYRKHGQMEWAPIAILFAGLIFSLTAPTYIWTILGI